MFIQIIDGKANIIIDGKNHFLDAGENIIMPANISHAVQAVDDLLRAANGEGRDDHLAAPIHRAHDHFLKLVIRILKLTKLVQ